MYMGVVSGERIFWNAIDDMTEPSSSAKMLDTFALTSTTVELTMLARQQVPTLEQVISSKTFDCISFMKFFFHRKADFVLVLLSDMLFFVTCALST